MKYLQLRVRERIQETADAVSLVLDAVDGGQRPSYRAGQFLTVRAGEEHRCYSLSSAPSADVHWKITVKRVTNGRVSNWINDEIDVGAVLEALPPQGNFVTSGDATQLVCFAAGSGITPVISIIKEHLATRAGACRLFYANRDRSSVIFARELTELAERHGDRLQQTFWLDDQDGELSQQSVTDWLGSSAQAEHYVCGPAGFMELVSDALRTAQVPDKSVHIERFTIAADADQAPAGGVASRVLLTLNGRTVELPVAPGQTVLHAAFAEGIDDIPHACTHGICGTCMAHLKDGRVTMKDSLFLTPEELAAGMILACQAVPETATCELEFSGG